MRRFYILLYALCVLLIAGVPAMAANPEIVIDATELEYDLDAKAVVATGNVNLRSGDDLEIRSAKMVYYDTGWVEAEGEVFINSPTGEYQGEELRYNLREHYGEIKKLKGKDDLYYISGQSVEVSSQEKTILHGKVTRCDRPRPCYHLHAGRIRLRDGRIIVERGWLSFLGVPVFPIPYANLSEDTSTWPNIRLGGNNERGLFIKANQSFTISPELSFLGGIGVGTEKWWAVEGGFRWNPISNITGEILYATESDKDRADLKFSGSWERFRLQASAFQEWDEIDEGRWKIAGRWSLWQNDEKKLYFEIAQEHYKARDNHGDWYGGDLPGARLLYSPKPNWTLGYGVRHGDKGIGSFGVEGWSNETTLNLSQKLGENWLLEFDGSYLFKSGSDHWVRQEVALTRKLHCYSAKISWDGVEDKWHFSLGLNW